MAEVIAVDETALARTIPLNIRLRAGSYPIVGTALDCFPLRGLEILQGRPLALVGQPVVGCEAASCLGLQAGGEILFSPEGLFNRAGQYPLRLNVVGVLGPTGTPDDHAIFVDLHTGWIIDGIFHGHEDLAMTSDSSVILERGADAIVANAKLLTHTVIAPETLAEFHFHGKDTGFPITAAIALPADQRGEAILLGRYQGTDAGLQLVRPGKVAGDLIATIFRIKRMLDAVVATVSLATVLTVALVFLLSFRLRARELTTIFRLGCSRGAIAGFVAAEISLIATAARRSPLASSLLPVPFSSRW